MVVHNQEEMGEGSAIPTDPHHTPTFIQPSPQPQKTQKPRRPKKKDTQVPQSSVPSDNVADEAVYKELDDSLVRAATTASSLEAEQDSGNIIKTRSKATPNEAGSQGTTSGGGPRRQETMGDTIAQTSSKTTAWNEFSSTMASTIICLATNQKFNFSKYIFESMVKNLDNVGKFLMCPRKPKRKDTQIPQSSGPTEHVADEVVYKELDNSLVRAVTTASSLEVEQDSGNIIKTRYKATPNKAGSQGTTSGGGPRRQETIRDTTARTRFESVSKLSNDPLLIHASQRALVALNGKTSKVKPMVIEEQCNHSYVVMLQHRLMKKFASKLQAEFDEEERLAREKDEANVVLTEEWDDNSALSCMGSAKIISTNLEQRSKHLLQLKEHKEERKTPTQAQQRKIMCTYLNNMEGKKPKDLKNKSFDSIQKMFDRAFKRVNTFVDFRTDLVEGSSKRAGTELEQEVTKKKKVDDVQEIAEVNDVQETAENHKEGKKNYYQIIKADGSSKMYLVFSHMLKSFDKEDLETLWKLIKSKYGSTRPVKDLDLILWGDLKTMFEPHVEDRVWKNQQDYRVLD
ncbi:hypothetical protein Tco_0980215 [Tanacetum coccineum]